MICRCPVAVPGVAFGGETGFWVGAVTMLEKLDLIKVKYGLVE